jgi:hypothetical protein
MLAHDRLLLAHPQPEADGRKTNQFPPLGGANWPAAALEIGAEQEVINHPRQEGDNRRENTDLYNPGQLHRRFPETDANLCSVTFVSHSSRCTSFSIILARCMPPAMSASGSWLSSRSHRRTAAVPPQDAERGQSASHPISDIRAPEVHAESGLAANAPIPLKKSGLKWR